MKNTTVSLNELINSVKNNTITTQDVIGKIREFSIRDLLKIGKLKVQIGKVVSEVKEKRTREKEATRKLDEVCSFTPELITEFLTETLTMIEGEEYKAITLNLMETIPPLYIKNMNTCLISTTSNIENIRFLHERGVITSPYYAQLSIKDGKCVMFLSDKPRIYGDDDYYSNFIVGNKNCIYDWRSRQLPMGFSFYFPYLEEVVIDLINFRLSNPDMSEEEAIKAMLQQIPSKYEHLIEKKKDIKKYEKATD